jgi:hypothetical protein
VLKVVPHVLKNRVRNSMVLHLYICIFLSCCIYLYLLAPSKKIYIFFLNCFLCLLLLMEFHKYYPKRIIFILPSTMITCH